MYPPSSVRAFPAVFCVLIWLKSNTSIIKATIYLASRWADFENTDLKQNISKITQWLLLNKYWMWLNLCVLFLIQSGAALFLVQIKKADLFPFVVVISVYLDDSGKDSRTSNWRSAFFVSMLNYWSHYIKSERESVWSEEVSIAEIDKNRALCSWCSVEVKVILRNCWIRWYMHWAMFFTKASSLMIP